MLIDDATPAVIEAAVVGMPHEIKGTGIAAFVTLEKDHDHDSGPLHVSSDTRDDGFM